MYVRRLLVAVTASVALLFAGVTPAQSASSAPTTPSDVETSPTLVAAAGLPSVVLVGKSVKGKSIYAKRQGNPNSPNVLLVLGSMHGDERKGIPVVNRIRAKAIPVDAPYQIWTILNMNPDGSKVNTRQNARKVDLNRNFPDGWKKSSRGLYYSGPSASSEPETREMMTFILKLQPSAVLSFHQRANTVFSICSAKSEKWVRRTGRLMSLPVPQKTDCKAESQEYTGTLNDWYSAKIGGMFATIELPPSNRVTNAKLAKYTKASITLAKEIPVLR